MNPQVNKALVHTLSSTNIQDLRRKNENKTFTGVKLIIRGKTKYESKMLMANPRKPNPAQKDEQGWERDDEDPEDQNSNDGQEEQSSASGDEEQDSSDDQDDDESGSSRSGEGSKAEGDEDKRSASDDDQTTGLTEAKVVSAGGSQKFENTSPISQGMQNGLNGIHETSKLSTISDAPSRTKGHLDQSAETLALSGPQDMLARTENVRSKGSASARDHQKERHPAQSQKSWQVSKEKNTYYNGKPPEPETYEQKPHNLSQRGDNSGRRHPANYKSTRYEDEYVPRPRQEGHHKRPG